MVLLFYITYISVDLAHHTLQIVRAKIGKGSILRRKSLSQYLCFLIKSTILHISLSIFLHELYYRNFTCTCLLHDK